MNKKTEDIIIQPSHVLLYNFLETFKKVHGYAPTLSEIGDGLKRARGTVFYTLNELVSMGCVRKQPKKVRGIILVCPPESLNKDS